MKNIILVILFFSNIIFSYKLKIYQESIVLGEPLIVEVLPEMNEGSSPYFLEIEGPEVNCILFPEFEYTPYHSWGRQNITLAIRKEGEYKINLIWDGGFTCWEKDEKVKELKRKDPNFYELLDSKKIKVNYPVGFDKHLWEDYLSKEERKTSGIWGPEKERNSEEKEALEEILKHPESNYYPWAVYSAMNYRGIYIPMEFEKWKKILIKPPFFPDKRREKENEKIVLPLIKYIEEVEKRWKDFPFIEELIFSKADLYFTIGKYKRAKEIIKKLLDKTKNEKLIEYGKTFLEKVKDLKE